MDETHEITSYKYYIYSSREESEAKAVLLLYGASGYLGGAFFSNSPDPLKPAVKYSSGVYGLYYGLDELPLIIDMLRNEKPVYLVFNGPTNSRITTTTEPVGEGEAHV